MLCLLCCRLLSCLRPRSPPPPAAPQVLADYPAGTHLKLGNTNAAVLPKVPKQQRILTGESAFIHGCSSSFTVCSAASLDSW
jgi:hypothetical protein